MSLGADAQRALRPADEALAEAEASFMQTGRVHRTLRRLAQALDREAIPYALVGGMALNLWRHARETVAFPDPAVASVERDGYRLISLEKLVELKLASGLSSAHWLRDLANVQDLIMALGLPVELGEALDESVRVEYWRMWAAAKAAGGDSSALRASA